jgi:hypothetical protein
VKKDEYISIRVTTYTKKTLEKLAKDQGRSTSGQIVYMLRQLLPQIEEPITKTDSEHIQSPHGIE